MEVIPAVDLREGRCVRLYQGKRSEETVFSEDPVEMACCWKGEGATRLHVVDLDGAFSGFPHNLSVIRRIVAAVGVPVQVGGGIRTMKAVEEVLDAGVDRVILGTVAIANPGLVAECCRRFGESIVVGIDSKQGLVAVEGWETVVERTAIDLAREVGELGVRRIIFTDTNRDGTLRGPNLQATRELVQSCRLKVIASGGVSDLGDLLALKELEDMGVEGVILGRALYTGAVKLVEALGAVGGLRHVS